MALSIHFLPDEPITTQEADLLGFSEFIADIKTAILYTQTPFVYGVLGDWGTGKTPILRLLEASFRADRGQAEQPLYVVPIWFNAWEYENEANIVYPLLHAIKRAFEAFQEEHPRIDPQPFLAAFRDVVTTSAFVLGDIGLRGATKLLTGDAYSLGDVKDAYDDVNQRQVATATMATWTDQVEKIKRTFDAFLNMYKAAIITEVEGMLASTVRFVILVDDLDRCLPDTVIRLLESIKNHLRVRDAVFVLALNGHVISQGIRHKYNNAAINGREYLEKILNYTFYVPESDEARLVTFVETHIKTLTGNDAAAAQAYGWYFTEFGRALRDCRFYNPRKIKRILNRYLYFLKRYDGDAERKRRSAEFATLKDWMHIQNAIRLLVIAEYFPEVFQLYLDPTPERLKRLRFGEESFNVSEFEREMGVRITESYPQMVRMRELFRFAELSDRRKPDLRQIARAVHSITRLL